VRNRSEQGKATPENRAQNDDQLARIPVSKRSGEGRRDHVKTEKRAGEITYLRVGEMKFALHQWLYCEQNRTVNIVKEIQRREQAKRGPRIKSRLRHLAKKYITVGCAVSIYSLESVHY
jgi:hypothetical protein